MDDRGMIPNAAQARADIQEYANHTTGTDEYHRLSPLHGRLVATDGVKLLCEKARCFWLVDVIASYQPCIDEAFQVWRIRRTPLPDEGIATGGGCVVDAWSDTPGKSKRLARQEIEFTDFPFEQYELWVEYGGPQETRVLMMKEER